MQSTIYSNLKSKTVRDLYWILFSETPLSYTYDLSPYALFPKVILEEWQSKSVEYFLALDKNAEDLENFVKRKKNKRLGFYAEALLSYFFQTFHHVELLLQNFQIIDELITIGEIDFIIRYNQKVIHLECAVKYYLLKNSNKKNDASQWAGPRLKDNLELKLIKIIQHQLPLGSRKEIRNKINHKIDSSYLFLKGIFFSEGEIEIGIINGNSPNQFIRQSQLRNITEKPVQILKRPNWLSSTHSNEIINQNEAIEFENQLINPEMAMFNDRNLRFIVADEWGKNE